MEVSAVILAAGAGMRLGGVAKACVEVAGVPNLSRVVRTLRTVGITDVVVVSGAYPEAVERLAADLPVRVVHNPDWRVGQTSSLRAGLSALATSSDVILFPVDHALVQVSTVERLLHRFDGLRNLGFAGRLVPCHQGTRGHPILFSRVLVPRILALEAGGVARDVFRAGVTEELSTDDPGVTLDLDTPEDLARASQLVLAPIG